MLSPDVLLVSSASMIRSWSAATMLVRKTSSRYAVYAFAPNKTNSTDLSISRCRLYATRRRSKFEDSRCWSDRTKPPVRDQDEQHPKHATQRNDDSSRDDSYGSTYRAGDILHRRIAIWKRMTKEDPYNALFGAANSALQGKGWHNPMWNQIPKWLQQEFWMEADRVQPKESDPNTKHHVPANASAQTSHTKHATKSNEEPVVASSEKQPEPESLETWGQSSAQSLNASSRYDPISGRMIRKHSDEHEARDTPDVVIGDTSTSDPKHWPQAKVHNGENVSVNTHSKEGADATASERADPNTVHRETTSVLSKLPEHDIDFLRTSDVKARMGRVSKHAHQRTPKQREDERQRLEKTFNDLHDRQDTESIQLPTRPVLSTRTYVSLHESEPVNSTKAPTTDNVRSDELSSHVLEEAMRPQLLPILAWLESAESSTDGLVVSIRRAAENMLNVEQRMFSEVGRQAAEVEAAILATKSNTTLTDIDEAWDRAREELADFEHMAANTRNRLREYHTKISALQHAACELDGNTSCGLDLRRAVSSLHCAEKLASETLHFFDQRSDDLTVQIYDHPQHMKTSKTSQSSFGGVESLDITEMANDLQFASKETAVNKTAGGDRGKTNAKSEALTRTAEPIDAKPDGALSRYDRKQNATAQNPPIVVREQDTKLEKALQEYGTNAATSTTTLPTSSSESEKMRAAVGRECDTMHREAERDCLVMREQVQVEVNKMYEDMLEYRCSCVDHQHEEIARRRAAQRPNEIAAGDSVDPQSGHVPPPVVADNQAQALSQSRIEEENPSSVGRVEDTDAVRELITPHSPHSQESGHKVTRSDDDSINPTVATESAAEEFQQVSQLKASENRGIVEKPKQGSENIPASIPPYCKIIRYDYDEEGVRIVAELGKDTMDLSKNRPIPLGRALAKLDYPEKFVPYLSADYEIIGASDVKLILRRIDQTMHSAEQKQVVAGAQREADVKRPARNVNPIDGTTVPLPQNPTGNFASPTGFVSYDHDHYFKPAEPDPSSEQQESKPRRGGGVVRVLRTGIICAGVCYCFGVVGELLR